MVKHGRRGATLNNVAIWCGRRCSHCLFLCKVMVACHVHPWGNQQPCFRGNAGIYLHQKHSSLTHLVECAQHTNVLARCHTCLDHRQSFHHRSRCVGQSPLLQLAWSRSLGIGRDHHHYFCEHKDVLPAYSRCSFADLFWIHLGMLKEAMIHLSHVVISHFTERQLVRSKCCLWDPWDLYWDNWRPQPKVSSS